MKSLTEQEYLKAFDEIIEAGEKISLNKVALKAGKKPGSLREARYPELCRLIQIEINKQRQNAPRSKAVLKKSVRLDRLNNELAEKDKKIQALLHRVCDLENELFRLTQELLAAQGEKVKLSI